jgi:hypothetical protein
MCTAAGTIHKIHVAEKNFSVPLNVMWIQELLLQSLMNHSVLFTCLVSSAVGTSARIFASDVQNFFLHV